MDEACESEATIQYGDEIGASTKIISDANSINDYASGLSLAIGNNTDYISLVSSQRINLASAIDLGKELDIASEEITSFLGSSILPLSSAIVETGAVSANIGNLLRDGVINAEQFRLSNDFLGSTVELLHEQQSVFESSLSSVQDTGLLSTISEPISSVQAVSGGISEMIRSLPTFPENIDRLLPNLEKVRENGASGKTYPAKHQKLLDELLLRIDPKLVKYRKAVWATFDAKADDYIGQSTSSMRRLVDDLLRVIAPEAEVVKTIFFITSPKAKDDRNRPTRLARIKYVVAWDENKADHLTRLVDGFIGTYGHLPAWDHTPLNNDGFVHGAFITIEGLLISLLSEAKTN